MIDYERYLFISIMYEVNILKNVKVSMIIEDSCK